MNLNFQWRRLESFTVVELYELIAARESVFVVEQNCAYLDADGLDLHAWHLSMTIESELVGYARVIDPSFKFKEPCIGRVMTLKKFRHLKLGRGLMTEAIAFTEKKFPEEGIRISAQAHLQSFYESLDFQPIGDTYDEDGILHIDMARNATVART